MSKKTTQNFGSTINRFNLTKYKRLKTILKTVEKFSNRNAVKWYFRFLSGATPELWKIKRNGVKCIFCDTFINDDFVTHILLYCKRLNSRRNRYHIYGKSCKDILFVKESKMVNLLKFLTSLYNQDI